VIDFRSRNQRKEKTMSEEQDWTDPNYVVGAVLAQLEDLEPLQKIGVLADVLCQVCDMGGFA